MSTEAKSRGFWQRTLMAIEVCREESTKVLKITKLKWDTTQAKRHKHRLYQKLGQAAYNLAKSGELKHESFNDYIHRIESILERIEKKENQIQELSALVFTKTKKS